jgi:hypothetical protein
MPYGSEPLATAVGVFALSAPDGPTSYCDTLPPLLFTA